MLHLRYTKVSPNQDIDMIRPIRAQKLHKALDLVSQLYQGARSRDLPKKIRAILGLRSTQMTVLHRWDSKGSPNHAIDLITSARAQKLQKVLYLASQLPQRANSRDL